MNKYYFIRYYREYNRIPCPYCYRKTKKGLEYRHARELSIKKAMARAYTHRYYIAL